jgi:hypothetical protein
MFVHPWYWTPQIEAFLKSSEMAAWRNKIKREEAKGALPRWNEAIVQGY